MKPAHSAQSVAPRYKRALRSFLRGAGEAALQEAYDLGRQAMTEGLGALDLARIHKEAFLEFIEELDSKEKGVEYLNSASTFFVESLATFEMTHRGFQETIAILSTRTAELEAANRALEGEVSRRTRVEDALRASEERYRELVEKALDVIYTLSTEGTITSLNPAFEKITGWSVEEWIGKPFLPLVHPQDVERCMHMYEQLLRGETPPMFELQIQAKSGAYLYGEFRTTPQWRDGEVVGVLGVARDITQRRRAEEELRTSQLQLAEAQQIAHLGNWEWDLKKNTLTWSAELYNIFGVKPVTFTPSYENFLKLVHPDDREMVRGVIERALKDRKPFKYHHRILRPDGTIRINHSRGIVVTDRRGNPTKLIGTGQDVTEAKQAEEMLRELPNRILNAQEAERRRLARELHDDVCQRLSGMKLSIDLLEHDVSGNKRAVKKIELAKSQIDHIITDIRRISWNLRPTTLDDLGLVVAMRKLCRDLKAAYKTDIRFRAAKNIPQHFDADVEIAMYRIVQESIMNAIKHARPSLISVKLKRVDDSLVVSVSDNGRGFDVKTTPRRDQGRGLGLLSMRERAHLLQGTFILESSRARGTHVTVTLPLKRTHETH